jgi:hypothetical protein
MPSYLDIVSSSSSRSDSPSSSSSSVVSNDDRPFLIVATSTSSSKNVVASENRVRNQQTDDDVTSLDGFDRSRGFQFHQRASWYDERMKRELRPKNYRRPGSCKVIRKEFGNRSAKTLNWCYGCGCRNRMLTSLHRREEAREELLKACAALVVK